MNYNCSFMKLKTLKVSLNDLKEEINRIKRRNPKLKDDSAFVFWFLQAYLVNSEEVAKKSLTGDTSDKSIDAIFIDDKARQANIIQGKFHYSEKHNEKRNDVIAFANLSNFPWESKSEQDAYYSKLDPFVRQKLEELVHYVRDKKYKYKLNLFYVTTGKCSKTIVNEVEERVRHAEGPADIHIIDYQKVLTIFKNYLEGQTPAVPTLTLKIISAGIIQHQGVIWRFDPERKIESWVFTMSGKDVGDIFAKAGISIFARNIRGYLGDTEINNSMSETIEKEPHNFWYYNNGVTMVCDEAKKETKGGEEVLVVDGAQIINGQQTTRTLKDSKNRDTNVLVKVIKIPRTPGDYEEYDRLVNSIVRATNWQNRIDPSDLVSNDYIQVFLERELRKRGYQYIRKKMQKKEAKLSFDSQGFYQIDKREMAQAVAACLFDPVVVRKGKEGLFEDPYYKSIFGSHSIPFYLSKYWLMKQVQYVARGYPERAYAKWLVINFAWKLLSKYIGSNNLEKRFRQSCEYNDDYVLLPLRNALVYIFRAALKFWRLNRGRGAKAKDVSSFFQLHKLHVGFGKFWNSSKNPYRKKVKDNIKKFIITLKELEIEE